MPRMRLHRLTAAFVILMPLGLAACGSLPPFLASDGAMLYFDSGAYTYSVPGRDPTICRFDKRIEQMACDDGTVSPIRTMGLPFTGAIGVQFDGKHFSRLDHLSKSKTEEPSNGSLTPRG